MSIALDSVQLTQTADVVLYVLDCTPIGGPIQRFAGQVNELGSAVVWQGDAYQPLPIEASGFEATASGPFPRPHVVVSNVLGTLGSLIRTYDNLRGAFLIRKRTKAKFLDAVNFAPRRNLLVYTNALSNGAWGKVGASAVSVPFSAPDGGTTAWRIVENTASGSHYVSMTAAISAGSQYTASVHVAKSSTRGLLLQMSGGTSLWGAASNPYAYFDPATGAVAYKANCTVAVQELPDLWRLQITTPVAVGGGASNFLLMNVQTLGYAAYTGDGASGAVVWGPQLEVAASASQYQPVIGASWSANPNADPLAEWPDELWVVDHCVSRNRFTVEWELVNPFDFVGVMLPGRVVDENYCQWVYRSSDCGYTGPAVAKLDDTPTSVMAEDRCSHRLTGCQKRFGTGVLPASFFPGVGRLRQV